MAYSDRKAMFGLEVAASKSMALILKLPLFFLTCILKAKVGIPQFRLIISRKFKLKVEAQ